MTEITGGIRAFYAGLFCLTAAVIVFARLLPLHTGPVTVPGPDLILCLVIAWSIRRPELLPLWLLAPVLLVSDLLLMRPPGLHTALVIAVSEGLRVRHTRLQTLPIGYEIGLAGLLGVGVIAGQWLVLAALFVEQPSLWLQLTQAPINALAYPAIVVLCHVGFGLRKRPTVTSSRIGRIA